MKRQWMRSPIWFFVALAMVVSVAYFSDRIKPTSSIAETDKSPVTAEKPPATPVDQQMKLGEPLPANIFVELARVINPSVVSVAADVRPQRMARGGGGPGPRDPFWEFLEEFMGPQGVPRQQPQEESEDMGPQGAQPIGTGFIIDADGLILTNNHVVEASDSLQVQLIDNPKMYPAKVIGRDPRTDIALIKIDAKQKLPVAHFGSSDSTKVGEWVAAFGNPYGHTFSMSKGIISAKGRKIRELNAIPFLQTDASINPGNSGGPLVNMKGEVIGVNSAIDARAQGIGFAIPIDHVKALIPQLKKDGRITYGFIGIEMALITPQAKQALKLKNNAGALVASTMPGGPADRGGIQSLDVIVEFDGKKVDEPNDLVDAVKETPIGKDAKVIVTREGRNKILTVKVGEPPADDRRVGRRGGSSGGGLQPPAIGKQAPNQLGFKIVDYSEKLAKQFEIAPGAGHGPIVVEVIPGSAAAQNGLRAGDMVIDVNRKPVRTASEAIKALTGGTNILRVKHGDRVSLVFIEAP